jgi:glycosyltransferase involved in cell wall biosynthesis
MLSIVINVKNGENHLARCLDALSRFSDIVLLDNFSTDRTVGIAKQYSNVRTFEHEFCGMGRVRNIAAGYAKNDWLLFVDCDEVLHPKLVDYLLSADFKRGNLYAIKRRNYYANRFVDTSSWENDWVTRLYNRNDTSFAEDDVHESVKKNKLRLQKIKLGFIYHFPYNEVSGLIDKMQFYSTLYARQNFNKKRPTLYMIPFRAFCMFIKSYILKRGFMDGFEGFAISSYNAIGVFSKYIKLYELYYKRQLALAFMLNDVNGLDKVIAQINEQVLLPDLVFIFIEEQSEVSYQDIALELHKRLDNNLCMPYTLIGEVDQDISLVINSYLLNYPQINHAVYIEKISMLSDVNLFKKCKQALLANKNLVSVQIINN